MGAPQLCTQPCRAAAPFCLLEQASGSRENELCEDFYRPIMCAQGAGAMAQSVCGRTVLKGFCAKWWHCIQYFCLEGRGQESGQGPPLPESFEISLGAEREKRMDRQALLCRH